MERMCALSLTGLLKRTDKTLQALPHFLLQSSSGRSVPTEKRRSSSLPPKRTSGPLTFNPTPQLLNTASLTPKDVTQVMNDISHKWRVGTSERTLDFRIPYSEFRAYPSQSTAVSASNVDRWMDARRYNVCWVCLILPPCPTILFLNDGSLPLSLLSKGELLSFL